LDLGSGKFNLWLKNKIQPEVEKKIQPVVEAPSFKLQASSLTMAEGFSRMSYER